MVPMVTVPTVRLAEYGITASNNYEDVVKNIDVSEINNKVIFFRFMGLEIKNSDKTITDKTCRNNDKNGTYDKLQENPMCPNEQPSEVTRSDTTPKNLSVQSTTNIRTNKRIHQSDDMIDSRKSIKCTRECSVVVIGEKCRICGKNFKCVKDVEVHTKNKHRSKKPRRKHVVLRIGDEVIGRVSIRKKHLKRAYRETLDDEVTTFISSDKGEKINRNDRINDGRLATPLISVEDICDIADTASRQSKIDERNVLLSSLGDHRTGSSNRYGNNSNEEIMEVLRIRRLSKFGPSINHETPNRAERELLLSDAIREFDRMENDPMDMLEFTDNGEPSRDLNEDLMEDYCWLGDGTLRNDDLDIIENNCSYRIKDGYDIDSSHEIPNSLLGEFAPSYFNDENLYSKEYRKENGEIVPDFIDYTQCLNNNYSRVNANNNNNKSGSDAHNIESSFYNEAQINEWNHLTKTSLAFNGNGPRGTESTTNLPIVIKEEVILDETPISI
ncbi:uncharacterized protein [Venturia canescens]|uniref:uncharacterized protein n=1 Tax=Venturia canescens TaxID=32260 RepID=UPI001C9BF1B3|nr:uncharacterized protein LOC122412102 [Venturia canescens]XP_043277361.1 uncharacterized protein LOC122412102 [Venturia canescens]